MHPSFTRSNASAGFTLIEALIALCILAIAASALIGATGAHINRVTRLENRAFAQVVAENKLVELRLAGIAPETGMDHVTLAARNWDVVTATDATTDPDLLDVKITVLASGTTDSLLTLRGFVDAAKPR